MSQQSASTPTDLAPPSQVLNLTPPSPQKRGRAGAELAERLRWAVAELSATPATPVKSSSVLGRLLTPPLSAPADDWDDEATTDRDEDAGGPSAPKSARLAGRPIPLPSLD